MRPPAQSAVDVDMAVGARPRRQGSPARARSDRRPRRRSAGRRAPVRSPRSMALRRGAGSSGWLGAAASGAAASGATLAGRPDGNSASPALTAMWLQASSPFCKPTGTRCCWRSRRANSARFSGGWPATGAGIHDDRRVPEELGRAGERLLQDEEEPLVARLDQLQREQRLQLSADLKQLGGVVDLHRFASRRSGQRLGSVHAVGQPLCPSGIGSVAASLNNSERSMALWRDESRNFSTSLPPHADPRPQPSPTICGIRCHRSRQAVVVQACRFRSSANWQWQMML